MGGVGIHPHLRCRQGTARDAIRPLAQTPRPQGAVKLTGQDGWQLRMGDYRIIYGIESMTRNESSPYCTSAIDVMSIVTPHHCAKHTRDGRAWPWLVVAHLLNLLVPSASAT